MGGHDKDETYDWRLAMDGNMIGVDDGLLNKVRAAIPLFDELREMLPVLDELRQVKPLLTEIRGMLAAPKAAREWYSVEESAKLLGKRPYTVREWCREGRVNARKRAERRGGAELWNISADEVTRVQDEGLLPAVSSRNRGR